MSEQLRESLSAAMDGEADAFELRRVLDEAKLDGELREQWHRFHILRDLLRNEAGDFRPELRESVFRALNEPVDDEETVAELVLAEESLGEPQRRSPWFGRIAGTAVAAGVAFAVMFNGGVFDTAPDAPVQDFATSEGLGTGAQLAPAMYSVATPQDMQRQNALMLSHIQHRAINQAGVASFVKLATFRNSVNATDKPQAASGGETMASGEEPAAP